MDSPELTFNGLIVKYLTMKGFKKMRVLLTVLNSHYYTVLSFQRVYLPEGAFQLASTEKLFLLSIQNKL